MKTFFALSTYIERRYPSSFSLRPRAWYGSTPSGCSHKSFLFDDNRFSSSDQKFCRNPKHRKPTNVTLTKYSPVIILFIIFPSTYIQYLQLFIDYDTPVFNVNFPEPNIHTSVDLYDRL